MAARPGLAPHTTRDFAPHRPPFEDFAPLTPRDCAPLTARDCAGTGRDGHSCAQRAAFFSSSSASSSVSTKVRRNSPSGGSTARIGSTSSGWVSK